MMIKSKLKTCLKHDVPQVNFDLLREKTFETIRNYDEKRRNQKLHFVPKAILTLAWAIFIVSFFSFLQDVGISMFSVSPSVSEIGFSPVLVTRVLVFAADNIILMILSVMTIVVLYPRFLGIRRTYEKMENAALALKSFAVQAYYSGMNLARRLPLLRD